MWFQLPDSYPHVLQWLEMWFQLPVSSPWNLGWSQVIQRVVKHDRRGVIDWTERGMRICTRITHAFNQVSAGRGMRICTRITHAFDPSSSVAPHGVHREPILSAITPLLPFLHSQRAACDGGGFGKVPAWSQGPQTAASMSNWHGASYKEAGVMLLCALLGRCNAHLALAKIVALVRKTFA